MCHDMRETEEFQHVSTIHAVKETRIHKIQERIQMMHFMMQCLLQDAYGSPHGFNMFQSKLRRR